MHHAADDHDESKVGHKTDNDSSQEGGGDCGGSQSGNNATQAAAVAAGIAELDEKQMKHLQPDV